MRRTRRTAGGPRTARQACTRGAAAAGMQRHLRMEQQPLACRGIYAWSSSGWHAEASTHGAAAAGMQMHLRMEQQRLACRGIYVWSSSSWQYWQRKQAFSHWWKRLACDGSGGGSWHTATAAVAAGSEAVAGMQQHGRWRQAFGGTGSSGSHAADAAGAAARMAAAVPARRC
eukprot:38228-Chlamydomonas_euryale.AAC.1